MPTFTTTPCRTSPLVVDFILVKARTLWPQAIVVDRRDDVHGILSPAVGRLVDAEIYPSEADFLRVRDHRGTSAWLAIQSCDKTVTVFGDDLAVELVAALPIWRLALCQTPSAS